MAKTITRQEIADKWNVAAQSVVKHCAKYPEHFVEVDRKKRTIYYDAKKVNAFYKNKQKKNNPVARKGLVARGDVVTLNPELVLCNNLLTEVISMKNALGTYERQLKKILGVK